MKADKARKLATETPISELEYKVLMRSIAYQTKCGKFKTWEESLTKPTKEKLIEKGFKVKKLWTGGYNISW